MKDEENIFEFHATSSDSMLAHGDLSASPVQTLPEELLERILTLLLPKDLLRASHVSRAWREASKSPIQKSCLQDGLKLPKSGVNTCWGLRAHFEKVKNQWAGSFLDRAPSYVVKSPNQDRSDWYLPRDAIQVTENGLLCRGKENIALDLPSLGSDLPLSIKMLTFAPEQDLRQGCLRVLSSNSFVTLGDPISLCYIEDDVILHAVKAVPTLAICGATADRVLATGHSDGIRLWTLPDLALDSHIQTSYPVRSLKMSDDGSLMVSCSFWGENCRVWNLQNDRVTDLGDRNFFLITNRNHQAVFVDNLSRPYPGSINFRSFTPDGVPAKAFDLHGSFHALTLCEPHHDYLFIGHGYEAYIMSQDAPHTMRTISLPMVGARIQCAALSQDSRWFIVLDATGDIFLWDLSLQEGHPSQLDDIRKSLRSKQQQLNLPRYSGRQEKHERVCPCIGVLWQKVDSSPKCNARPFESRGRKVVHAC